jgi:peptide/nickel transport system permease protein
MSSSVSPGSLDVALTAQRPSLSRLFGWRPDTALVVGASVLLAMLAASLLVSWLRPGGATAQDLTNVLQPPSASHPFGTDNFGRDIFTRVLVAAQLDLQIAIICTLLPFVLGVTLGSLAGYLGGGVDAVVMRTVDVISAFPFMVIVIGIIAMLGPGLQSLYVALTLVVWRSYARIIRGELLGLKKSDYVVAARALGYGSPRVMFRHMLPNVITPAIVFAMSDIVAIMLSTAALGFLGLGVQPPTPEWGTMVADGRGFITTAWWLITFPGLAVLVAGIAFSLLGDGVVNHLRVEN